MGAQNIIVIMKFSALPNEVKIDFINQVAAKSNRKLPEQIIEKDWWVTQVLKAVFSLPYAEHLSFKGGITFKLRIDQRQHSLSYFLGIFLHFLAAFLP